MFCFKSTAGYQRTVDLLSVLNQVGEPFTPGYSGWPASKVGYDQVGSPLLKRTRNKYRGRVLMSSTNYRTVTGESNMN